MDLFSLQDLNLDNKTIFLRTNYDVPIKNGIIVDDRRIKGSFQTINFLLSKNCKIIILSHLGRPRGTINPQLSLKLVADRLQQLLPNAKILFSSEVLGPITNQLIIQQLQPRQILLLENLRFDPREEANDEEFAKQLASLGDVFVNEAFAVSHRNHASITQIPTFIPSYLGFEFCREIEMLTSIKNNAQKPIVIILGGKKEDKLKFIELFSKWADYILIGGLLPKLAKKEGLTEGKTIYATLTSDAKDITLESAEKFSEIIVRGKTIIWNGTMDLFEDRHNQAGTRIIATAIVEADAKRYAGGGDTTAAIKQLNLLDKFDFISSGGGAMLEMLAFGKMAGLEVL